MRKYNIAPQSTDVENIINLYFKGDINRDELASWGMNKNVPYKSEWPVCAKLNDPIANSAFFSVCSSNITDKSFKKEGPPYFIRDYDLEEWCFSMKRENPNSCKSGTTKKVFPVRPHQIVEIHLNEFMAFNISSKQISNILHINHLRGLDELDYFQEFNFVYRQTVFQLLRHMRSPEPDAVVFYSNLFDREIFLDILKMLNLDISDALWINSKIGQELKLSFCTRNGR